MTAASSSSLAEPSADAKASRYAEGKRQKLKGKSEDEEQRGSHQPLTIKDSAALINRR